MRFEFRFPCMLCLLGFVRALKRGLSFIDRVLLAARGLLTVRGWALSRAGISIVNGKRRIHPQIRCYRLERWRRA